jgi:hypothetical protein
VEEIGRSGIFQPSRLAKGVARFLMTGLLLKPAGQEVIATGRRRLPQQLLKAGNSIESAARDLQQTPRAPELNVRIIRSDAENSLIRVCSRLIPVQAEEQAGQPVVKLRTRVAPDHHQDVYRRDVASGPGL